MRTNAGPPRALVVGAGIGGLTSAVALARRGWKVEVVEISPGTAVAGWGLSLTGPALRALDVLGLAEPCARAGHGIVEITNCDAAGNVVDVIPLQAVLGPGRPSQIGLSRPALHGILCREALRSGADLRHDLTVDEIRDHAGVVDVALSDGSHRTVDLLVGADGVHSRVRSLLGMSAEPTYTGLMVWRALVPRPTWANSLHTFAGRENNAGLIPIAADQAYVFLTESRADRTPLADETLADALRELLAPFGGRFGEVRDQITDPASVVRRPVQVMLLEGPWHRGRSILVGDAVHAPSPQLVSGAALAIEDGLLLAEELAVEPEIEQALVSFENRRLERCRLVVESSVRVGELTRAGRHVEAHALQQRCFRALAAVP